MKGDYLKPEKYKTVKVIFIKTGGMDGNSVNAAWEIRGRWTKVAGSNKSEAFDYAKKYIDEQIIKSLRWKNE